MADTVKEYASILNHLIETCKDGEKGFREAAEAVKNSALMSLFTRYSTDRAQFARELQDKVAALGEPPETTGTVAGALHRGWIDVKAAITGKDDHAIVAECERGEDHAVDAYQDALSKDLAPDIRQLVERQYVAVKAAHDKIRDLKHGQATAVA